MEVQSHGISVRHYNDVPYTACSEM